MFKKYQKKKSKDGFIQDFKIYECDDCSGCPFKFECTKAKGNHQVHWNTIYEEMNAKAKEALEDEHLSILYAKRKVVCSVISRAIWRSRASYYVAY